MITIVIVIELVLARVCREAGARVGVGVFLCDLSLEDIVPGDRRKVEIIANGLPCSMAAVGD